MRNDRHPLPARDLPDLRRPPQRQQVDLLSHARQLLLARRRSAGQPAGSVLRQQTGQTELKKANAELRNDWNDNHLPHLQRRVLLLRLPKNFRLKLGVPRRSVLEASTVNRGAVHDSGRPLHRCWRRFDSQVEATL